MEWKIINCHELFFRATSINYTYFNPNPLSRRQGDRPAPPPADADHWPHLQLEFLKPERRRDATGRRPDDPEFDPRTLRVPGEFLDKQTPVWDGRSACRIWEEGGS